MKRLWTMRVGMLVCCSLAGAAMSWAGPDQRIDPEVVKILPLVVSVPAGTFEMGAKEKGSDPDEQPVHKVTLPRYWMGRFEVTNAQYKAFVDATGYRPPDLDRGKGSFWRDGAFPPELAGQPLVGVSWEDAVEYCKWISKLSGHLYRLPTEAEWERAARGGLDGKRFTTTDGANVAYWWYGQTWRGLATLKPAEWGRENGFGIYGMSGNAAEWCADWYDEKYYATSPSENPKGPDSGKYRVVRGGSWLDDESHIRVAYRDYRFPTTRDFAIGFRVVREFKEQ